MQNLKLKVKNHRLGNFLRITNKSELRIGNSRQFVIRRGGGFTLVELIVYVALLGLVSVFIANNLSQIVFVFNKIRAEREVNDSARLSLERITKEIQESSSIYAPTSVFQAAFSQISLISAIDPTAEHTTTYVDIYVDNGRLYLKREGAEPLALTSDRVKVSQFRAEHIVQSLGRDAIKITFSVDYNTTAAQLAESATLHSTIELRGGYSN